MNDGTRNRALETRQMLIAIREAQLVLIDLITKEVVNIAYDLGDYGQEDMKGAARATVVAAMIEAFKEPEKKRRKK